ncbi:MAG: amidohydrolase [Spirochaetia bacterium]|nr:amidohydrolase [Spirochaetia bacterium]
MDKTALKKIAADAIEASKDRLITIGRDLYAMPEPGFREFKTSAYVERVLTSLGLKVENSIAITGLRAVAKGKSHNSNIGIMGELDSLLMPGHPRADQGTGAAHACGHHAQLTMMLGTAFGLVGSDLIKELDGDITLLAVPAEEVIELSYRRELAKAGKIRFFGGKQEFIRLGVFDDIDAVLCSHITNSKEPYFDHSKSYNGVLHKSARFIGKSSHAALSPQLGVNALHAAVSAINNINALREKLDEKYHMRVHYIITKGGDSPNIIPDDVRMELGVRASTAEMMVEANKSVNRALIAGAEALGAKVEINDQGAYLPLHQHRELGLLYAENAKALVGPHFVHDLVEESRGSSTDAGDLASVVPAIHPNFGGSCGPAHTNDFDICDEYLAYVQPPKVAAMTVIDLLYDGAAACRKIRNDFVPLFNSKEEYCDFFTKFEER